MPIKWKDSKRFKPAVVLARIDKARTVNTDGGASFAGFDWEECLPALHSMLEFPVAAKEVDAFALMWKALTRVRESLTPSNFLAAANEEINALLAKREETYRLLTTISVRRADIPAQVSSLGTSVRFLTGEFPKIYGARDQLIKSQPTNVPPAPRAYTRVIAAVRAKSPDVAFHKAMQAIDLQRSLWCLMGNSRMQIAFGMPSMQPINVVRLGGHHTVHKENGLPASDEIWFEPGYIEAKVFAFAKAAIVRKNCLWAHRRICQSRYEDKIVAALIRYVRALDESDANTAFLRLWSAVELLATPGNVADYGKLVRRCSFLFHEVDFHRQMLEHLREYRNSSVHSGEYSDRARTLCFQLQMYFHALIWFHIRNAGFFTSLDEANEFLETPPDKVAIARRVQLAKRALKFLR